MWHAACARLLTVGPSSPLQLNKWDVAREIVAAAFRREELSHREAFEYQSALRGAVAAMERDGARRAMGTKWREIPCNSGRAERGP